MSEGYSWPTSVRLQGLRLQLEPLTVEHAAEAAEILNDERLHKWIGGAPPTQEELVQRYRRQIVGHSPDGQHGWLNWLLRKRASGQLIGTVQATLYRPHADRIEAELAWIIGHTFQGVGYGKEGASTMAQWLRTQGVSGFVAHVHPGHAASEGVATALGLKPTAEIHDGEVLWADFTPRERPAE